MEMNCRGQVVPTGVSSAPHHRDLKETQGRQHYLTSNETREDEMTDRFVRELDRGNTVPPGTTIHDLQTLLSPGPSGSSPSNWAQVLLRAGISRQQPVGYFKFVDGSVGRVRCSFLAKQQGVSLILWADSTDCVRQLKRVCFSSASVEIAPPDEAETFGFAIRFGKTTTVVALAIPENNHARSVADYRRLTRQILSIIVHELAEAEEGATEYGSRVRQDQYLSKQAAALKDPTIGPVWGSPMSRLRSVRTSYSEQQYHQALTEALQLDGPILGVPSPKPFDRLVLSRNAICTWRQGIGRLSQDVGTTTYGLPVVSSGDARARALHVVEGDDCITTAHAVGESLGDRALDDSHGACFREFVSRAIGYRILRSIKEEALKAGADALTTEAIRARGGELVRSIQSGEVHRILKERIESTVTPLLFEVGAQQASLELFGDYPSLRSAERHIVFLTEDYYRGAAISISSVDSVLSKDEVEQRLLDFTANRERIEALLAEQRNATLEERNLDELGAVAQFLLPAHFLKGRAYSLTSQDRLR